MDFLDPIVLQTHLHADFNTLMKNIKTREQQHQKLREFNENMKNNKSHLEETAFLCDQINISKSFLQQRVLVEMGLKNTDNELAKKYEKITANSESIITLIKRVGYRIIEIIQSFLDKIVDCPQTLIYHFSRMKSIFTKQINQKSGIKIENLFKILLSYEENKIYSEIHQLKLIIKILQNGQFDKLSTIHQVRPPKQINTFQQKRSESTKPKYREKSCEMIKKERLEIKDRIKLLKQQSEKNKALRKQQTKVAKKLFANVSDVLLIQKQEFIELFHSIDYEHDIERNKIYNELLSRNKYNSQQIIEFESKRQNVNEKLISDKQNNILTAKIQNIPDKNPTVKSTQEIRANSNGNSIRYKKRQISTREKEIKQSKSQEDLQQQCCEAVDLKVKQNDRYPQNTQNQIKNIRATLSQIEDLKQFKDSSVFSSQKHITYAGQVIGVNLKKQTYKRRQKLPEILTRVASVDNKNYQKKSESNERKNIAKQVQLGVPGALKTNKAESQKIKFQQKRQKVQQKISKDVKSLGTHFFNEIGKKIAQFCQFNKHTAT